MLNRRRRFTGHRSKHCRINGDLAPAQGDQSKSCRLLVTESTGSHATLIIRRKKQHAEPLGRLGLSPDGPEIAPGNSAENTGSIAGIAITTATTAVLHASESPQGLLQHPVTGLTGELGQKTNATRVLLACNGFRGRTVVVEAVSGANGL